MDNYSQRILHRLAQNDETLKSLWISPVPNASRGAYFDLYNNATQFYKLGLAITTNTNLKDLKVHIDIFNSVNIIAHHQEFYNGLKHNSSIRRLEIHGGVERGMGYVILKSYEVNNKQLTSLRISNANLQNEVPIAIANTVRRCAKLQKLELSSCHITNEQLLPIIESIRKHTLIRELNLCLNRIGNDCCESLATLLEDPNSNIGILQLQHNDIGNLGVIAIANSLTNNTKLRCLYFDGNPITLSSLEDVFSKLLCNTSSIDNTYSSNHTLAELHFPDFVQPCGSLLLFNEGTNKKHVVMKKMLRYHPNIDMKPLFGWGSKEDEDTLKALPYIIDWFNRAAVAVNDREKRRISDVKMAVAVPRRKLSAIYQFAQAMPLLFAAATPFVASHAKDESTKKSRVEMESMNKVATENCCVIL